MKKQGSRLKVVAKSLSWACVSGVIIGATVYVETYNIRAAFVSALISALIKTPVYSAHEVIFDRVWHRKDRKKEHPGGLRIAA